MGMKYLVFAIAGVALGVLVLFFVGGKDVPKNYPPKNATIVAFGDSLVEGQGATEGNDFVSQLETRIGRPIENYGVGGNTTKDGVARMGEIIERDPGLVLIVLGGNDTLRRIAIEETERNLRTLIGTVIEKGSVVMFIGVRGGILGTEREDMYERVADEYGAIYVPDILDGILLTPELMHDGIHPNDAGYAQIADRLAQVFKEYEL